MISRRSQYLLYLLLIGFTAKSQTNFISKNDGQLFELSNEMKKTIVEGREYLKNTNDHIRFLKVLYNDCEEIRKDIDQTKLNPKSLIKLTKEYHNYMCDDQQRIVYEKKYPLPGLLYPLLPGLAGRLWKLKKMFLWLQLSGYYLPYCIHLPRKKQTIQVISSPSKGIFSIRFPPTTRFS